MNLETVEITHEQMIQAYLATKTNVLELQSAAETASTLSFRNFDAIGPSPEVDNIDAREREQDNFEVSKNQKEKDKENIEDAAQNFSEEVREQLEEFVKSLHGYNYTAEDFDAAIIMAYQNWDEFSKGMTDEQKLFAREKMDQILNADSQAERDQLKRELNEVLPEQTEKLEMTAESKIDHFSSNVLHKANAPDNFEISSGYSNSKPTSEIEFNPFN